MLVSRMPPKKTKKRSKGGKEGSKEKKKEFIWTDDEIKLRLCGIRKQSIMVLLFKDTSVLLNIVHNTNYTQNNHATKYYVPRSSSSNGW